MTYSYNNILDNIEPSGKENVGAFKCYWYMIIGIAFLSATALIGKVWGHAHVFIVFIGIIGLVLSFLSSIKTWSLSTINSYKEKIELYLLSNGLKNEVLLATSFGFISKSPKWSFVFDRRCGIALTNQRLLVFVTKEPGLSLEKTQWQNKHKFDIYSIQAKRLKKVSLYNVLVPPGIALFAKKLEFKSAESREPVKILAFIKFGKNSALLKKVWKRL